jgi:hypothetical protein
MKEYADWMVPVVRRISNSHATAACPFAVRPSPATPLPLYIIPIPFLPCTLNDKTPVPFPAGPLPYRGRFSKRLVTKRLVCQ